MKNVGKKLCVFLLVAVMVVGLLPAAAFADDFGHDFGTGPSNTVNDLVKYLNDFIIGTANGNLISAAKFGQVSLIPSNNKALQCEVTIYKAKENGQTFLQNVIGEFLEALYSQIKNEEDSRTTNPNRVKPANPDPSTCLGGIPSTCLPGTCLGGGLDTCMESDGTLKLLGLTGNVGDPKDSLYIQNFSMLTGLMQGYETAHDLKGKAFAIEIWNSNPYGVRATCTFVFVEPELEVTDKEEGNVVINTEEGTVTGTDLVNKGKASGKTVKEVTDMFTTGAGEATVQIADGDGKVIGNNPTAPVGTGYKVQLVSVDGAVLEEYTLIVKGDTSGDGEINYKDAQQILCQVAGDEVLTGIYETAGLMVDGESKVTYKDAQMILNVSADAQA